MTVSPPRRKSTLVFWLAAIVILTGIVATALLANNERNLRFLAERYHIGWLGYTPPEPIKKPPAIKHIPKPVTAAPRTVRPLPTHLLTDLKATPGIFLRRWKLSGQTLCDKIALAGFAVGPWHPSAFDGSTFECSFQTPGSEAAKGEPPSLFVIVRGNARGEVGNIRVKAILPETDAGKALQGKFQNLLATIVEAVRWRDFGDAVERIGRLENVTQTSWGARIVFSHEFAEPRRFNLILDLDRPTGDQKASGTFFDTSKWLPLPNLASRQ